MQQGHVVTYILTTFVQASQHYHDDDDDDDDGLCAREKIAVVADESNCAMAWRGVARTWVQSTRRQGIAVGMDR